MDAGTWISLGLGAYGSGLATVIAARQWRRERPRLSLGCTLGYAQPHDEDASRVRELPTVIPTIVLEAINEGTRPIEVRRAGFLFADGEEKTPEPYVVDPKDPPHMLGDGESIRFHFRRDERELPEHERREVVRAFVWGGGDRRWSVAIPPSLRPLHASRYWWK